MQVDERNNDGKFRGQMRPFYFPCGPQPFPGHLPVWLGNSLSVLSCRGRTGSASSERQEQSVLSTNKKINKVLLLNPCSSQDYFRFGSLSCRRIYLSKNNFEHLKETQAEATKLWCQAEGTQQILQ